MPNRIEILEQENYLSIKINALYDKKKQQLLLFWIILFSLCGIAILSQFFLDYPLETKVFFGVYIAFWLFFEFKVVYAYRWRKAGSEIFTLENNTVLLSKMIGERGITEKYNLNEVSNFELIKHKENFVFTINTNYWSINKYTISFNFNKQTVPFGIDLNEKEAKNVLHTIKKFDTFNGDILVPHRNSKM